MDCIGRRKRRRMKEEEDEQETGWCDHDPRKRYLVMSVGRSVILCLCVFLCLSSYFVYLHVYLNMPVFLCLSSCLSSYVCLHVCLPMSVFLCLSICPCLPVYLSMSVCLSTCFHLPMFICLCACLSPCLSAWLLVRWSGEMMEWIIKVQSASGYWCCCCCCWNSVSIRWIIHHTSLQRTNYIPGLPFATILSNLY